MNRVPKNTSSFALKEVPLSFFTFFELEARSGVYSESEVIENFIVVFIIMNTCKTGVI